MLRVFDRNGIELNEPYCDLDSFIDNTWISLVSPDFAEIDFISNLISIPKDVLSASLDLEERSRIEIEDNYLLVVVNYPVLDEVTKVFDTLPLGIILTKENIITVTPKFNDITSLFKIIPIGYNITNIANKSEFLFRILYYIATQFLRHLRYINRRSEELETEIKTSMRNKAFFDMLEIQKGLVYFTSALKDNQLVLNKLNRLSNKNGLNIFKVSDKELEMLEDVIIENKQAIEMVEMHSNILSSMMDAFASIVSNNLNIVMRFLTVITIVLAIPTMFASFWGMNVHVPFANNTYGFWYIVGIALITTIVSAFLITKNKC